MKKRKWIFGWLLLAAAVAILAGIALDQRLILRTYEVEAEQIASPVRVAVLTDYHGCGDSDHGAALLAEVAALEPDLILLGGDMFSAGDNGVAELIMFREMAGIAPTWYVTGNHEYWEFDVPGLLSRIRQTGVRVLDASCETIQVRDETVNICGIPDPYAGGNTDQYLSRAAEGVDPSAFTILLAHRPEVFGKYAANGNFDLVLCGHAHGGQVRIPGLINGLCAPNQGWFPPYAGGRYEQGGTTMIVSRGLSTQRQMGIPRVFNRPELLLVVLQ